MAKVTIKDIARGLGVSYTSVSRALTNRAGVSAETRERIIREAERLGYQPNTLARALVMQKTDTIGLLVPDITNPFLSEIARGVENTAQEYNLILILADTKFSEELEEKYVQKLSANRVDGLIVVPVSPRVSGSLREAGLPAVKLNTRVQQGVSVVTIDNVRGGYYAARHLIESGFRKIAFIGGRITSESFLDRLQGYRDALDEFLLPYDERLVLSDTVSSPGSAVERAVAMIGDPDGPDAFFAANDVIALELLRKMKRVSLPATGVGVVGFDDITIASFPEIELTTMAQPKYLLGRTAVELLVNEIAGERDEAVHKVVLEPELVVRRTRRT